MTQGEVRVGWEDLSRFTRDVFARAGLPPEDAETEAAVLIWANLHGVDSHGVLRIPLYMEWIDTGLMNPRPDIRIAKETPATLLVDADFAFGPVVTTMVMRRVMGKAREVGLGWGFIRDTTHQGAMAYYSLMAAQEGMVGIAIVCSPPNMAPHGARAAGLHNSPISIAVPAKEHAPLVLDMATSIAAGGKIALAVDKGIPVPDGWALDNDGNPTTDPSLATILMPFGGPKGSGLAMMFECLTSLMVGNPMLQPGEEARKSIRRGMQNSVVAAIDIGTFTDVEAYKKNVDSLIDGIKALPRAKGTEEIFVPGEPESRVYQERSRNGIPLPEGTVNNLRSVAKRFGVPLPQGL